MEDRLEKRRYFCQWRTKKRKCDKEADVIYEVETKGVGMCQEHFEQFCDVQEKSGDEKAREKIGLNPRKNQQPIRSSSPP